MSNNFYIVSLPYFSDSSEFMPSVQFDTLVERVGPLGQFLQHFNIPPLKVGTLDSLMEASDELNKLDPLLENTVQKLISLMEETSSKPRSVVTTFRINQTQEMSPAGYLKNFLWSSAQFDPKENIKTLLDKFHQISSAADEHVRVMLSQYNDTRNKLTQANRKGEGNLSVRPIQELVAVYNNVHHCFVSTELLTSVFVAVPVASQKEWLENYWKLHEYVCPQSNRVIAEDKEYVLNSVVVFRKIVEDFKAACRKRRYVIRDVESGDDMSSAQLQQLQQSAEKERKTLYTLLWQQYCVCYVAWIHVKAVRVFVESLLKYGLPPRFIAFVLEIPSSKEPELRKRIAELFPDIINPIAGDYIADIGSLQQEFPYVSLKVTNVQKESG